MLTDSLQMLTLQMHSCQCHNTTPQQPLTIPSVHMVGAGHLQKAAVSVLAEVATAYSSI